MPLCALPTAVEALLSFGDHGRMACEAVDGGAVVICALLDLSADGLDAAASTVSESLGGWDEAAVAK